MVPHPRRPPLPPQRQRCRSLADWRSCLPLRARVVLQDWWGETPTLPRRLAFTSTSPSGTRFEGYVRGVPCTSPRAGPCAALGCGLALWSSTCECRPDTVATNSEYSVSCLPTHTPSFCYFSNPSVRASLRPTAYAVDGNVRIVDRCECDTDTWFRWLYVATRAGWPSTG